MEIVKIKQSKLMSSPALLDFCMKKNDQKWFFVCMSEFLSQKQHTKSNQVVGDKVLVWCFVSLEVMSFQYWFYYLKI